MTLSLDLGLDFPTNKTSVDKQKLRGGYYTPTKLARYLAEWAIRQGNERILEPSSGDGNFLVAALQHLANRFPPHAQRFSEITAVEIEPEEQKKAKERCAEIEPDIRINWVTGDFFQSYGKLRRGHRFTAILGNPPFIRFQHFDNESRDAAFAHLRSFGYHPTKLANAWAAFVELSIELLEDGGRLALVVPAELLQVTYAGELRSRLASKFAHVVLVAFRKLVFPEIQQEVLLLLAEGKRDGTETQSDIHILEFEDGEELLATNHLRNAVSHMPAKHSRPGMKWTSLFLSDSEFQALDETEKADGVVPLGQLAEVDIGVVTGRNSFFVLTKELRRELKAARFTVPTVGRTSALKSILFSKEDFANYCKGSPSFVLALEGQATSRIPNELLKYIKHGEEHRIHHGYKCRIRQRWFDVPSVYVPDAFLFRQIHTYPLFVANAARATSTDTVHRVRLRENVECGQLAAAFFNSLTLAWAEVCGRSYGGGVLELEPREAEHLPIPFDSSLKIDPAKVDRLLRRGRFTEALNYVDGIVLKTHAGFADRTIKALRRAWEKLRDRRNYRRR